MAVYPEISLWAGQDAAVYIGAKSFSNLALASFRNSLSASLGQVITLAAVPYAVRLDSAVVSGGGGPTELLFNARNKDVFLKAPDDLILTFSLGVFEQGSLAAVLTTLTLEIRNLEFEVTVSADKLSCTAGSAETRPAFKRADDFDALVNKYGLDLDTVTRIEGMLLYGGLATTIAKSVSTPQAIDLSRLFPGVRFVGAITFLISSDSRFLFLKPAQGFAKSPDICECADIGDGIGPVDPGTITPIPVPNDPGKDSVGTIGIGGPKPVTPTPAMLGLRRPGEGDAGFYMPNKVAQKVTIDGPFPGFRVDLSDNGFIGWKAVGFVDFDPRGFKFEPDPAHGRIYITLTFRVECYGSVHVDLGKLGKIRVTNFSAEQAKPGANFVKIGVYLVLGTKGVYLKPILEDADFGKFDVFLTLGTLVGTPFGGWGAVIGFIFDKILGELIAMQIPVHLNLAIREAMAKMIFPIIEANYAAEIEGSLKVPPRPLAALYAGDKATGFLFSTGIHD